MGTRHLTAVILGDEPRVAQYGQWDGYPSETGVNILKFLEGVNLKAFTEAVEQTRFEKFGEFDNTVSLEDNPHFSRDMGSEILGYISDAKDPLVLANNYKFAADSLFCEWGFIVNLDDKTLECYRGFVKAQPHGRFSDMDTDGRNDYRPIHLLGTYNMDCLPEDEDFVKEVEAWYDESCKLFGEEPVYAEETQNEQRTTSS